MFISLAIIAGLLAPLAVLRAQAAGPAGAEIVFLDVGQGDAILIRSDTFAVLIDAGGNERAMRGLGQLGVRRLHLAIASHNHRDHIGGMDVVLDSIPVKLYIDNGCQESTEAQAYVENAIRDRRVPWRSAWDTIYALGGMKLRILPSPFYAPACDTTQNNLSVGVLVEIGKFQALLTGDSEVDELNAWLRRGVIPPVTLIKAAHHGSRNGVTPGWIQTTRPELVVISVGSGNSYGHPAIAALRYYGSGERKVMRTDRDGSVVVCISPAGQFEALAQLDRALLPQCR